MTKARQALILTEKGKNLGKRDDLKLQFLSMLKERHPQLRGFTDDAKWGGKALPHKCPECGFSFHLLNMDLDTLLDWLIKEVYMSA